MSTTPFCSRRYWIEIDPKTDFNPSEDQRRKIEDRIREWLCGDRPVMILPPGVTLHHLDHPSLPAEPTVIR